MTTTEFEFIDVERRVAPAALRARAGFAKTHGRPSPITTLPPEAAHRGGASEAGDHVATSSRERAGSPA